LIHFCFFIVDGFDKLSNQENSTLKIIAYLKVILFIYFTYLFKIVTSNLVNSYQTSKGIRKMASKIINLLDVQNDYKRETIQLQIKKHNINVDGM
jgi:hypothetical protein